MLRPYFKLAYIKLTWGGPKEKEVEIAEGNPFAKDWQDEVRQVLESTLKHSLPTQIATLMSLTTY